MTDKEPCSIRKATKEDCSAILLLIQELATFEKMPEEVNLSTPDLERDGFGNNPAFECWIIESKGGTVGMALCYERYSTWKGRTYYLEDLIVTQAERGRGYGTALLQHLITLCKIRHYARFEWQVLEWNDGAMRLYQRLGAQIDDEWLNCRIVFRDP